MQPPLFRRELLAGFGAAALTGTATPASAQPAAWPDRMVTLFVPLAAGSTADIMARIVAPEIAARIGQTLVIDNRPAAGGTVVLAQVARSTDLASAVLITMSTQAISPFLYGNPGYDPVADFTPVAPAVNVANALIVNPQGPHTSLAALIDAARRNPGWITYSSGGSGTTHHLSGALLAAAERLELVHVPYRGAPQGVNAVAAGEVDFGYFNLPSVIEMIQAGRLRGLAVTSPERSPFLPELPTQDELGLQGCQMVFWMGFGLPARIPAAGVERFAAAVNAALALPEVQERLRRAGFELAPSITRPQFAAMIASDIARLGPVARAVARVD
ncbi:tripartite tricarboxylate transporter substrate binding protein [Roseomonas hellenica]|uniref:Tripartite tricarboxylate transporter substrate binding protein n=1 Tax=Plastoroseomonas hellenica TaxID=2687306 RepID=A0ABS5ETZ3_9PROT|nr:tripartite tricarboxylate transporter substrate-binding protein [Plastoroseomonas hellenica]MBR0663770.1 tripartite tricarboxylate transporter substrate binding protein [Plastoroseomonas hellenica]